MQNQMQWRVSPQPELQTINSLAKALAIQPVLAALLVQRGIHSFKEARDFFRPEWAQLHDPFLMKGMAQAVTRLQQAVNKQERILIYGDYDVDGTTSVALMAGFLKGISKTVGTYIPDREKEGYGVSKAGITYAKTHAYTLIITLDCGIKAVDNLAFAANQGLDVIVCDHHLPGEELPKALAILNPKQEDCTYPFKALCGCGVGFKLLQAYCIKSGIPEQVLKPYLDLVAVAIAADMVAVTGENRILLALGSKVLAQNPRPGLGALSPVKTTRQRVSTSDIVFGIAPKINAAGRMAHALLASKLLMETNKAEAQEAAAQLMSLNKLRQDTEKDITNAALAQIKANKETTCASTVVYHANWHKGVIGIVASRLIETYYRPTVVFAKNGAHLVGSARTVSGFNVHAALTKCQDHFVRFGGHKSAAGITLKPENFEAFKKQFEAVVATDISPDQKTPILKIDYVIPLSEISEKLYRILAQFAPFGPGNMRPVFQSNGVAFQAFLVGDTQAHLKVKVWQSNTKVWEGIGFNMGYLATEIKKAERIDIVYTLDENTWQGQTRLQLKLKDIRPTALT